MISYRQAMEIVNTNVLSHSELKAETQLEELLDTIIIEQILISRSVSIPCSKTDKILEEISPMRRLIVLNLVFDKYKKGGWSIKFDNDEYSYILTGE
jgi:hypothetical protein